MPRTKLARPATLAQQKTDFTAEGAPPPAVVPLPAPAAPPQPHKPVRKPA